MHDRVQALNTHPFRSDAKYVLYWAQMNRRVDYNQALAYAVQLANEHALPVLFYEGLTCSYPYASDRLHTFILEGVPDTSAALKKLDIGYIFHLRRRHADPNNALYQLAAQAGAVVTDDYPTFIARRHNARVPQKLGIPYFVVDASCVVPMNRIAKREYAAYTIRPKIKKLLPDYLNPFVQPRAVRPYTGDIPEFHTDVIESHIGEIVESCEIDHSVKRSPTHRGGSVEAQRRLNHFLHFNLRRYARERNEPSARATSGLSPYLHFGHISALDIALQARACAAEHQLIADEFLEELIVRRELAFNHARFSEDPGSMENLPDWAIKTMAKHANDPRSPIYGRDQLELAKTYDELWNATQTELLLRGTMHGYYRMYWGKKIVEWSATYQEALDTMIYFHDRYSLDGRDPNTYTNILWCLGLHDRPWAERPIFGMLRSMTLQGMRRKTNVEAYIQEIRELGRQVQ